MKKPGVKGQKQVTVSTKTATVKVHKPLDLLLVLDASGSINFNQSASKLWKDSLALVTSLGEDDRFTFAFYSENRADSYRVGDGVGFMTTSLTKNEAVILLQSLSDTYGRNRVTDVNGFYNWLSRGISDKLVPLSKRDNFETIFDTFRRPGVTTSVIQFTDQWEIGETIDTSFAEWAKTNAKTFMSVVYPPNESATSINSMIKVGHPNIYNTFPPVDKADPSFTGSQEQWRAKKLIDTFENTSIESVTGKPVTTEKIIKNPVNEVVHVGTGELDDAKSAAIVELDQSFNSKRDAINKANVTPDARTRLLKQLQDEYDKWKKKIQDVTDVRNMPSAKSDALSAINVISVDKDVADKAKADTNAAKTSAIDAINKAAADKNREIDNADITPDAKTRLKAQVKTEQDNGIAAVNGATTVADVNKKRDDAVGKINAISVDKDVADKAKADTNAAKTSAIDAINKAAADKNQEIDTADITPDAKARLKAQVKTEQDNGIAAVNGANNVADVNKKRDDAVGKIKAVSVDKDVADKAKADTDLAKSKAVDAINKAAADKNQEIDHADITPDAKTRLKAQVKTEQDNGIAAVNGANNVADVNKKRDDAVGKINAISVDKDVADKAKADTNTAKTSAIDAINKAAADKNQEIDNADITPDAKTRLKAQVKTEQDNGIAAVNGANNVADVNKKRDDAIGKIKAVSVEKDVADKAKADTNAAKTSAIDAINKAAADKNQEIDHADITPDAKTRLKAQVKTEQDNGIAVVNGATTVADVNKKRDDAISKIKAVSVDKDVADKKKADDLLASKLKQVKDQVRDWYNKLRDDIVNSNLPDDVKSRLLSELDVLYKTSLGKLNTATLSTIDAVMQGITNQFTQLSNKLTKMNQQYAQELNDAARARREQEERDRKERERREQEERDRKERSKQLPKTGDIILTPIVGMLTSALGLLGLTRKRKSK